MFGEIQNDSLKVRESRWLYCNSMQWRKRVKGIPIIILYDYSIIWLFDFDIFLLWLRVFRVFHYHIALFSLALALPLSPFSELSFILPRKCFNKRYYCKPSCVFFVCMFCFFFRRGDPHNDFQFSVLVNYRDTAYPLEIVNVNMLEGMNG